MLTISECFSIAQKNSAGVKINLQRVIQARENFKEIRGDVLPEVSFNFEKKFQRSSASNIPLEVSLSKITASQPLFSGFKNSSGIKAASAEYRSAQHQARSYIQTLYGEIAVSFYRVAGIESDKENILETISLMLERVDELDKRVRLGKSRRSEVLLIQSRIAALRAEEEQIKGEQSAAMGTLVFLLGITNADSYKIADDLPELEEAGDLAAYTAYVKERPDIKALEEEAAARQRQMGIAKAGFYPSLDIDASRYLWRNSESLKNDWDVILEAQLPIFRGGSVKAAYDKTSSLYNEAVLELEYSIMRANTEVTNLHTLLDSSIKRSHAFKEAYKKARESYELQIEEYSLGLVTNLEVLESLTAMLEVKKRLDTSIIDVKSNKTLLDIAVGRIE